LYFSSFTSLRVFLFKEVIKDRKALLIGFLHEHIEGTPSRFVSRNFGGFHPPPIYIVIEVVSRA